MKQLLLTLFFTLSSYLPFAQFLLTEDSSMATEANGWFGNGASFIDFNEDGLDDLTFCSNTQPVKFFVNDGAGSFTPIDLGINIEGDTKQPLWFDFDNDGDKDFFCSRNQGSCRLYRNDSGLQFTDISATCGILQTNAWETHGTSCGDYDQDGYLDLYICNYNHSDGVTNYLYRNNGDGTFSDVTTETGVTNDSQTTFDATWLDYDKDGDLDLFLINDRVFFANALYRNNGDNTFTDIAANVGFNHYIDAMSLSCGDYDNDGDFDFYIANGAVGNLFLEYEDNQFVDIAQATGTQVNSVCWGAIWLDYNCNMTQDLYSANYPYNTDNSTNHFFINNGSNGFTHDNEVIDNEAQGVTSPVIGDVNGDGYPDIALNTANPSQSSLLKNTAIGNAWLKVNLEGTISNRDAIGTLVETWSSGVRQSKVKFGSSNFMGQDSDKLFFGFGSASSVDSLIVFWPNGHIDKLYQLPINQTILISEGESLTPTIDIEGDGCEGSPFTLTASMEDAITYVWDDGTENPTLEVDSEGIYSVSVTNAWGVIANASVEVSFNPTPLPEINITPVTCADMSDGSIEIFSTSGIPIETIIWEGVDQTGTMINMIPGGTYPFTVIDENGCTKDSVAFMPEPPPIQLELNIDHAQCSGELGSAEGNAFGGTGELAISWSSPPNALEAGNYSVSVTDENGCTLNQPFQIVVPDPITVNESITEAFNGENGSITLDIEGGTDPYSVQWSNGQIGPIATELGQGVYSYVVSDDNDCLLSNTTSIIDLSISPETHSTWFELTRTPHQLVIASKERDLNVLWMDAGGRMLVSNKMQAKSQLNIPLNYSAGIYFLTLTTLDKQFSRSLRIFIGG